MDRELRPASVHEDEIDLFELVQDIWREKVLVVVVGGIVTMAALAYALLATPVYQAVSQCHQLKRCSSITRSAG